MNVYFTGVLAPARFGHHTYLNGAYLRQRYKVTSPWRGGSDRWHQRRDYRFYKCPSCRTRLRVPRGKGKINIVCRKCGTSFQRKT